MDAEIAQARFLTAMCLYADCGQAKNMDCCSRSAFQGPFRRWIMLPSQQQQLLFLLVNRKCSSNISICHPRLCTGLSPNNHWVGIVRLGLVSAFCDLSFCLFLAGPFYTYIWGFPISSNRNSVVILVFLYAEQLSITRCCIYLAVSCLTKKCDWGCNYKWTCVMSVNADVYVLNLTIVRSMKR